MDGLRKLKVRLSLANPEATEGHEFFSGWAEFDCHAKDLSLSIDEFCARYIRPAIGAMLSDALKSVEVADAVGQ